ncbi:MAG: hypothetical protein GXP62_10300 [Oligoflexia bacterium]|nr:hypothetical protein [Oligoflexia bacterium]
MRHALLVLTAAAGITACGSDYKVSPDPDQNTGVDSGVPETTTPTTPTTPPVDTGTAPTTDEPGHPIAVCSVSPNPVTPPFEAAIWDGSDSYDPGGGTIIDYTWTLISQPDGSALTITGAAVSAPMTPLIAGTYTGQLVVTNDAGVPSDPSKRSPPKTCG